MGCNLQLPGINWTDGRNLDSRSQTPKSKCLNFNSPRPRVNLTDKIRAFSRNFPLIRTNIGLVIWLIFPHSREIICRAVEPRKVEFQGRRTKVRLFQGVGLKRFEL